MNQGRAWYEIVISNWSQIVVLIGTIAFFMQKIFELNLKKKEIKFTRLQENKILEIKAFYKSYQALELALKQYLHQTEFGEHSDEIFTKIKENIRLKFVDFDYNCMTVKLFIDNEDIETVDEIRDTFDAIRLNISRWHIYNRSPRHSKLSEDSEDKLSEMTNDIFPKKLPALIKKIESSLRKNFNLR